MMAGFFIDMPKLNPENQELRAKALTALYLKKNGKQTEIAKAEGVTKQAINDRLRRKYYRDYIKQYLSSDKLKKKLTEVSEEALNATRPIGATILVNKDGQLIRAEDEGAIEVPDHNARHKYWHDLMVGMGELESEKDKAPTVPIINVIHYCPHGKST